MQIGILRYCFILLLAFIVCSDAKGQGARYVLDSCTNRWLIWDTLPGKNPVYRSREYYGNHLLTEGRTSNDIPEYAQSSYFNDPELLLTVKYPDTLMRYDYAGNLESRVITKNGNITESWVYTNGNLYAHTKGKHSEHTEIEYSDTFWTVAEFIDNQMETLTIHYYSGKTEVFTKLKKKRYEIFNYYNAAKNYYAYLWPGGDYSIIATLRETNDGKLHIDYPGNETGRIEIICDKRTLPKDFKYGYDDDHFAFNFNKKNKRMPELMRYYTPNGLVKNELTYNKKTQTIRRVAYENHYWAEAPNRYFMSSIRKTRDTIAYKNSLSSGVIRLIKGVLYLQDTTFNKEEVRTLKIDTSGSYFNIYREGKLYRHTFSKEQFRDLRNDMIIDRSYSYHIPILEHLYYHEGHISSWVGYHYFQHDTIINIRDNADKHLYHTIKTGGKTYIIHSKEGEYIAKDQATCQIGLKSEKGQWLVPPIYENLVEIPFLESNCVVYLAVSGNTGTIFNNRGGLLVPPTAGLDRYPLKVAGGYSKINNFSDIQLIVNNSRLDSFYLINIFGNVSKKGAGRLERISAFDCKIIFKTGIGYIHRDGTLIPPIYTDVKGHYGHVFLYTYDSTEKRSTFMVTDLNGKAISPLKFDTEKYIDGASILCSGKGGSMIVGNSDIVFKDNRQLSARSVETSYQLTELSDGIKKGLINESLRWVLPMRFDKITITYSYIIAHTNDSTFLFGTEGKLRKGMKRQELKPIYNNFVFLTGSPGHYGLIDIYGNTLFDNFYDDICTIDEPYTGGNEYKRQFQKWVCIKDEKPEYYNTRGRFKKSLKMDAFVVFIQSQITKKRFLIIPGQPTLKNVYGAYKHGQAIPSYDIFNDSGNQAQIGRIDIYGKWLMLWDRYSETRAFGYNQYVKMSDDKVGVVDCKGDFIIPPVYTAIAYNEFNHMLWYRHSLYKGKWHLKNNISGAISSDSFDYPVKLTTNLQYYPFCIDGKIGLMDNTGTILVPGHYDHIFYTYMGSNVLLIKDNKIYTWYNGRSKPLQQPYTHILRSRTDGRTLFGIRGNMLYFLNAFMDAVDSTDNLYLKNPEAMADKRFRNTYDISPNIGSKKIQQLKQNIRFLNYMEGYNLVSELPYAESPFPAATKLQVYGKPSFNLSPVIYTGRRYIKSSLQQLTTTDFFGDFYSVFSESRNTISFSSGHNAYQFTNILIDTLTGFYAFNLSALVAKDSLAAFTKVLHAKWLAIDNPEIPCLKMENIFSYFENNFYLDDTVFYFNINGRYRITLTREELLPYFTPYWRKMLQ